MKDISVRLTRAGSSPVVYTLTEVFGKKLPYIILFTGTEHASTVLTKHTTMETGIFALSQEISRAVKAGWIIQDEEKFRADLLDRIYAKISTMHQYLDVSIRLLNGGFEEPVAHKVNEGPGWVS